MKKIILILVMFFTSLLSFSNNNFVGESKIQIILKMTDSVLVFTNTVIGDTLILKTTINNVVYNFYFLNKENDQICIKQICVCDDMVEIYEQNKIIKTKI